MSDNSEPPPQETRDGSESEFRWIPDELDRDTTLVIWMGVAGGVLGASIESTNLIGGFFVFGGVFALTTAAFATESGRSFLWKLLFGEPTRQEDQWVFNDGTGGRVCSHCGWQNPPENSHCHDCGEPFGDGSN